ncbi:putative AAA family ATPase [Vibrio phage 177E37-1]|nr:putative AAA family ATPase [Vibrio phage 177E37-1]
MQKNQELYLNPDHVGFDKAVLLTHMKDGWDLSDQFFTWDEDAMPLKDTLEGAGYTIETLVNRWVVTKGESLYAYLYPLGNLSVSAVASATDLAALVELVQSNPRPIVKPPEGTYRINFRHMFINKYDDIDNQTYSFDNHSEHLANLQGELYPKVDVSKLMDVFVRSEETVLILTGEPGTGKTCFTKMLCKAMAEISEQDKSIFYVKDPELLKRDDFWIMLQSYEPDLLILDDLDDELKPRTQGKNTIMNHMLSFSDGIFPKKTKIIITTNQPNSDIDKAITRPGRCFDILALPRLTADEAMTIWIDTYDRTPEQFTSSFGTLSSDDTISQAALVSEHKRLFISDRPKYLTDPSISIRQVVEEGGVANATAA